MVIYIHTDIQTYVYMHMEDMLKIMIKHINQKTVVYYYDHSHIECGFVYNSIITNKQVIHGARTPYMQCH